MNVTLRQLRTFLAVAIAPQELAAVRRNWEKTSTAVAASGLRQMVANQNAIATVSFAVQHSALGGVGADLIDTFNLT